MTLRQSIERYQRVMATSDDPAHASVSAALSEILSDQIEWRPKLDTKRMRACSPLLPAPGDEVVRECLDEIESLQSALAESRAECERLRMQLTYAAGGIDMAYEAIQHHRYDEALLHAGHHSTRAHAALETK